jgi:outer membrane receptor protein involved in Fe transport
VDANYAWFGFAIKDQQPGAEPQPNAPAHRASAGATYQKRHGALSFHYRWVDTFPWASGVFVGSVPSYGVADVNALIRLSPRWDIGINVANAFDNRHYEFFGGDLLARRVLVHPTFSW